MHIGSIRLRACRRKAAPTAKNPRISIAQVAGSGTPGMPPGPPGGPGVEVVGGGVEPGGGVPPPPPGMNSGPPSAARGENGDKDGEPMAGSCGGAPPPGSTPPVPRSAGSKANGESSSTGDVPRGGSRSRTLDRTRSFGPALAPLVESSAPEPRPPGERSAKRESGSFSAATIAAPLALLMAGWQRSATATNIKLTNMGSSRSVRFHLLPRLARMESGPRGSSPSREGGFVDEKRAPKIVSTPFEA